MAQWLSWLERRPVTAEVVSSSLIWVVYGVLAQLGEHLPYKQRVIGSSPIGPIFEQFNWICGYGGIGRHKRLKISRGQLRAGSSPATRSISKIPIFGNLFLCHKIYWQKWENIPSVLVGILTRLFSHDRILTVIKRIRQTWIKSVC